MAKKPEESPEPEAQAAPEEAKAPEAAGQSFTNWWFMSDRDLVSPQHNPYLSMKYREVSGQAIETLKKRSRR